jgi:hypothetical protein
MLVVPHPGEIVSGPRVFLQQPELAGFAHEGHQVGDVTPEVSTLALALVEAREISSRRPAGVD